MKVWLFQDITHRDSAVRYGRFGISYQSHVQGLWISGDAVGWGTALQVGRSRGSIPESVIGVFHWHNPSSRTTAMGLTQPLTEMNARNICWGVKCGRCVGLTTLTLSCPECLEIWNPLGLSSPAMGLFYIFLIFSPVQGSRISKKKNLDYLRFEEGTGIFCRNIGNKPPIFKA